MNTSSKGSMPNRLYVAGFSQMTLSEEFPSPQTWDGIDEVHLQSYHLFGRHKYSKGKVWVKNANDALGFVTGQLVQDDHTYLIVPNSDLFLACCRFDYWTKEHKLTFARSRLKTRLKSQENYSEVDSCLFGRHGNTTILKLENKQRRISIAILDLCNFGCGSLLEYLDMIGELEKVEAGKYDGALTSRQCAAISLNVANEYIEALLKVNLENKMAGIRFTIGGMAKATAKQVCGHGMFEPHDNEAANDLERQCYLGARIESFGSGLIEEPVYHLDISSHYPYQVMTYEHATKLDRIIVNPTGAEIDAALSFGIVFAKCRVECNHAAYPCRRNGRTIYPVGSFDTHLCSADFVGAYRNGDIKRIYLVATYQQSNAGKAFMEYLASRRQDYRATERKPEESVCKLMANSWIGKTAQIGTVWEPVLDSVPVCQYGFYSSFDADTKEESEYRIIDWNVERKVYGIEPADSFPAFAASVVAYARQHTYRLLRLIGIENVFSVCGDGILCNQAGFVNAQPYLHSGPPEPGKLRLVGISERMEHVNATCYRSSVKTARSGEVSQRLVRPADVMQAISEDAAYDASMVNTRRFVNRRILANPLDRLFEEAAQRQFIRHGSPILEEPELPLTLLP